MEMSFSPQNSYSAVNLVDSNLDDSPIPEYAHFARDLESDSTVPDVTVQDMVLANSDPIIVPSQVDDQQWSLLQTALQVSPSGCSRFGGDSPCGQHSDCSSSCYGSSPAASPLPQATETMESSCSGSDEEEPRRTTAKKSGKKPVKMPQRKGGMQLWQFLYTLLSDPKSSYRELIEWTNNKDEMEFRLNEPEAIAIWWGEHKNKKNMSYDKLSRSLRYYYDKGLIRKISGERYVYRFCVDPEVMYENIGTSNCRPKLKPMPCHAEQALSKNLMPFPPQGPYHVNPSSYHDHPQINAACVYHNPTISNPIHWHEALSVSATATSPPRQDLQYPGTLDSSMYSHEAYQTNPLHNSFSSRHPPTYPLACSPHFLDQPTSSPTHSPSHGSYQVLPPTMEGGFHSTSFPPVPCMYTSNDSQFPSCASDFDANQFSMMDDFAVLDAAFPDICGTDDFHLSASLSSSYCFPPVSSGMLGMHVQ